MPDEFARLAQGLPLGLHRFRTGVFAAWYPIKQRAPVRAFHHRPARERHARHRRRLNCGCASRLIPTRLNGCGLVVVNPPYRFEQEAPAILAALLDRLGNGEPGEAAP